MIFFNSLKEYLLYNKRRAVPEMGTTVHKLKREFIYTEIKIWKKIISLIL
jgi:hypothetical protein